MERKDRMKDIDILNDFLLTWPIEKVQSMKLDEYVNLKNPETFCQYVETKTRLLGSINGQSSMKFGIYKRGNVDFIPKNAISDNQYTWASHFGETRSSAFKSLKQDLISIINAAQRCDLEAIDDIHLHRIYKWKVAFLYSNESFIPIFKQDALWKIAGELGMSITKNTKYSEIHKYIANTKPVGLSVYDYMRKLYSEYKIEKSDVTSDTTIKHKSRKGTTIKNTESQLRSGTGEHFADQLHNKLQNTLYDYLTKKYGESNVILEENHVDVKVLLSDEIRYYEVKIAGYAEECIKQGLGQLFSYAYFEKDKRNHRLIIFGQNKLTVAEVGFVKYIQDHFKEFSFEYLSLEEIQKQ
jgi:hypothetical protein